MAACYAEGMLLLFMLAMTTNGVVTRPVANMYSGPSAEKDVVSQAIYGTNIAVLEENGGWARIRTPDNYTGWMPAASFLSGAEYARKGRVARVSNLFANLYSETNITRHQPLLTVPFETRLEVVAEPDAEERRWIQVRLPDDRAAWIQRGDVALDSRLLSVPEMIEFARRFLGLPYLWGGTSTFGYDCSGFTQMLERQRGIETPRDAQPQADWTGVAQVSRGELKPGDLLFFGRSGKRITHTGIYIGGDEFIHATTHITPVIQVSRLSDPHWTELLVACRRVK
jgi:gamma-D-glutamyl-L-lysine dipeptidyl-peptidase